MDSDKDMPRRGQWLEKILRHQTDIMGAGQFTAQDWGLEICRELTSGHLRPNSESLGELWWLCELRMLNLDGCVGITDVSPLGDVHTLSLRGCTGVTDVSPLGRVRKLDLRGCVGVTDVSPLGDVHTLSLRDCTGVTDVSPLGYVRVVDLRGCTGVTNASMLDNVRKRYSYLD